MYTNVYLDEVSLWPELVGAKKVFILSTGREENLGTPWLDPILFAERDPHPRELRSLSHAIKSDRGGAIVGEVNGELVRGVVHGKGRDQSVHHLYRGWSNKNVMSSNYNSNITYTKEIG